MSNNYLFLIPLSLSALCALVVIVTNYLAIYYCHVNPLFPYLSDAASTHPEAGYATFMFNWMAILCGICGWIRYKQVILVFANQDKKNDKSFDDNQRQRVLKVNQYGIYSVGVIMVALPSMFSFRSTEHVYLHLVFSFATINAYCLCVAIQTWISYQMVPTVITLRMARFRLVIAILINGSFLVMLLMGTIALSQVPYSQAFTPTRLFWDKSWPGYYSHAISAISENIGIFMGCPYFGSFVAEFKILSKQWKVLL